MQNLHILATCSRHRSKTKTGFLAIIKVYSHALLCQHLSSLEKNVDPDQLAYQDLQCLHIALESVKVFI